MFLYADVDFKLHKIPVDKPYVVIRTILYYCLSIMNRFIDSIWSRADYIIMNMPKMI